MSEDLFIQNKKFLLQYRGIMKKVDRLEEKLYRIDVKKESLSSPQLSSQPGGGTAITLNDMLVQSEHVNRRINRLMIEANNIREKIFDVLDGLDDKTSATVLDRYFIERKDLDDIADELGYSIRQINRYYASGVRACHIDDTVMS